MSQSLTRGLRSAPFRTNTDGMPGPTLCPFCGSSRIGARLPVQGLHEYECAECERTWLVARQKRQAKIVAFPLTAQASKRRASGDD